ncbi:fructose-1,6-bisphosphatase [Nitzschia inconspicua]|uniref:Fructose-1,6-bisphosphatase n=1 Tax=Nitzschia inconspicua TaxID=303405 RepID=A0A9K3PDE0_9STRA|nr:fructose-1,6-bisphosphatase [Nitzschia inconspicua]
MSNPYKAAAEKQKAFAFNKATSAASSTSFYTTEEKKDHYSTLPEVLESKCEDPLVRQVIQDLMQVCADITDALRISLVTVEGSTNDFGDSQLSVDMISDQLLWEACRKSSVIREGASEEEPEIRNMDEDGTGEFTVCWDPLDGSSIIDNNWAVGTMIGVWPKSTGLLGATGRDQVTSVIALYGPRTTVLVALDDGVYEFTYGAIPEGSNIDPKETPWICTRHQIQINEDSKIFSPANLRSAQDLPGYQDLVNYYMTNRYTLRYTGGFVPDCYMQFTKNMGVFCNPTSQASPAKLRVAFEAAPFGLLIEKAGGLTSDGVTGKSVLDVTIESVDQRTALCCGSKNEVLRFNKYLGLEE